MTHPYLRAAMACCLAAALGCNSDSLLVERPKDVIAADNLFVDAAGFEAALNGLYSEVRRERFGTGETSNDPLIYTSAVGTDNGYGNYADNPVLAFQTFGSFETPTTSIIRETWNVYYETINAANTIISRAENPGVRWTAAEKDRITGEARLIRAWAYRHLTYLFGDVPLNLEESTGSNYRTDWDRTPRDSVRKVIISDLLYAEAKLPATSTNDGKLTKAVARHYLAEMYLALGDAVNAEAKAAAVINSGTYRLVTARYGVKAAQPGVAFMDQFQDGNANRSQGNTETLWTLQYAQNVPGGGGSIMRRVWVNRYDTNRGLGVSAEYGGRGLGRMSITKWALGIYEASDVRGGSFAVRRFYTLNNAATLLAGKKLGDTLLTVASTEKASDPLWPSTRKWDWTDPADVTGAPQYNDQPYLRLAETYLLLAEAQFRQGNAAGAAATLNILRARAGATAITAAQVTLDFILDERSRELVTEEQRRYTLVRTGTYLDRVKRYNPLAALNIQPRDTVLPIPQTVIDANLTKKMPQNGGY